MSWTNSERTGVLPVGKGKKRFDPKTEALLF